MKKIWYLFLAGLFTAFLVGCGGDEDNRDRSPTSQTQEPGQIPGLGEYPGEIQGDPFTLPEGVYLNGSITGDSYDYSRRSTLVKGEPLPKDFYQKDMFYFLRGDAILGSGHPVIVSIPLINSNPTPTEVVFPARLVMKARSTLDQNGLLLKKASTVIPAGSEYTVTLVMYCGNLSRMGSSPSSLYEIGVIINSPLIEDLTKRLVDKKINVEEHAQDETPFYDSVYYEQYERLSNIVWNLTDRGIALSEDDKQWIANLPLSTQ